MVTAHTFIFRCRTHISDVLSFIAHINQICTFKDTFICFSAVCSLSKFELDYVSLSQIQFLQNIYLTGCPQFVRTQCCVSKRLVCSTGPPQCWQRSCSPFTLQTSPSTHKAASLRRSKMTMPQLALYRQWQGLC